MRRYKLTLTCVFFVAFFITVFLFSSGPDFRFVVPEYIHSTLIFITHLYGLGCARIIIIVIYHITYVRATECRGVICLNYSAYCILLFVGGNN